MYGARILIYWDLEKQSGCVPWERHRAAVVSEVVASHLARQIQHQQIRVNDSTRGDINEVYTRDDELN